MIQSRHKQASFNIVESAGKEVILIFTEKTRSGILNRAS